MRRWNGWGDETTTYAVPAAAAGFLESLVGTGSPRRDASLPDVIAGVPASRLPAHPLISQAAPDRVRHARGQSLPDWIALRSGRLGALPDGVAFPTTHNDVRAMIDFAAGSGIRLIPYGGGTSVAGHINPPAGDAPVLTLSLARLKGLRRFDEASRLATFDAGVTGPELEAQLRARGFTLGHFPQSFELSTLGGWIATRSSGQQSLGYGRIEALFAGGRVEAPAGRLELPPFPASAAGPDLRQLILGSEGRLGVITEATVRVTPLPEQEAFHALFLPDWERGLVAARAIVQAGLPLSMLRLSTPAETETTLILAGRRRLIGVVEAYLGRRGVSQGKCLLLLGLTGRQALVEAARRQALGLARQQGGVHVGQAFGRAWQKGRFRTPYLRNTLWDLGYAVDTLETAVTWTQVPVTVAAIESALRGALAPEGERVHVFTHLSHLYPSGASIYTTTLFRLADDPDQTLARWQRLKGAASQAIVACGGTISHQHGVGVDHAPYLVDEKGALGMNVLRDACRRLDPAGVMNPGKLIAGHWPGE